MRCWRSARLEWSAGGSPPSGIRHCRHISAFRCSPGRAGCVASAVDPAEADSVVTARTHVTAALDRQRNGAELLWIDG